MPSPTTAIKIIRGALGVTNSVGVDQVLTADETALGVEVFNDILEQWSTDSLSLWGQADQTYTTIPGQRTYAIGPTGDWVGDRPVRIDEDAYTVLPVGNPTPTSFICRSFTQQEYNDIAVKDQQNEYAMRYLFINDFPNALLTLWPVPSVAASFTFTADRILAQITNAGTIVSFPPGYAKAFKMVLAVELAPYFGKQASDDVKGIAREAYADIKRANKKEKILQFDSTLQQPRNWAGGNGYGYWGY